MKDATEPNQSSEPTTTAVTIPAAQEVAPAAVMSLCNVGQNPSMAIIETRRLCLREVGTDDAEFIFLLMNELAYIQHIGDRGVRTVEKARSYIAEKFASSYSKFGFGLYLVELKSSRVPVGICGFVRRDSLEHPDVGFAFARKYWSQGFAYEAANAMLEYGFGQLGFEMVLGVTSPSNNASIRLLEKLGLRYLKMARVPPNDSDSMLFSADTKRPNSERSASQQPTPDAG